MFKIDQIQYNTHTGIDGHVTSTVEWGVDLWHMQPQALISGFYISVFSILNSIDPLASVSNL